MIELESSNSRQGCVNGQRAPKSSLIFSELTFGHPRRTFNSQPMEIESYEKSLQSAPKPSLIEGAGDLGKRIRETQCQIR